MKKVICDEKSRVPAKVWATDLDQNTHDQILAMTRLPFLFKHLAVMPDAHWGVGSTVGTVIATKGAIIPAAVGVDIGCGMCAAKLKFKIDNIGDLKKLRNSIERSVPVGFNGNSKITESAGKRFANLGNEVSWTDKLQQTASSQLGSLGGGNHFIEICQDTDNNAWIMLHSGSRNLGKTIADIHIKTAQEIMDKYYIELPHRDLAFFPIKSPEFKTYFRDLQFCQRYAMSNREEIMDRVLKDVSFHLYGEKREIEEMRINCHHNYIEQENHFGHNVYVTRKGAVRAREDDWGIIPGSMGTKSFIVKGKGNPESFCSCSHGAGRKYGRKEAERLFTVTDLENQTSGVECRKDTGVLDEIPQAYKDIDTVISNQLDLIEPVYTLKQVLCVKG